MKRKNIKVAEFLVQKEFEHWAKDNKELLDDIHELVGQVMKYRIKWGIPVDLTITQELADEIKEELSTSKGK